MQILAYLQTLAYWDWFIAALALVILEIFAPGAVFLWLGIAAGAVGAVVFVAPGLDWKFQFTLFALLSVASIMISRRYLKRRPIETDHPDLNRRAAQYIGRKFILDKALAGGAGRMQVDDGSWRVVGPDLPAGSTVRVVGVSGASLRIEADTGTSTSTSTGTGT